MDKPQNKVLNISDILGNYIEYTPAVNRLSHYVNKIITIKTFETIKSKVKKKDSNSSDGEYKEAVKINFVDDTNTDRVVTTSAKYIIDILNAIQQQNQNFNNIDPIKREYVQAKVGADFMFGEYRNFYLVPPEYNTNEKPQKE